MWGVGFSSGNFVHNYVLNFSYQCLSSIAVNGLMFHVLISFQRPLWENLARRWEIDMLAIYLLDPSKKPRIWNNLQPAIMSLQHVGELEIASVQPEWLFQCLGGLRRAVERAKHVTSSVYCSVCFGYTVMQKSKQGRIRCSLAWPIISRIRECDDQTSCHCRTCFQTKQYEILNVF